MDLFFDVETSGLPKKGSTCYDLHAYKEARIVSIAWVLRSKEVIYAQHYNIIRQVDADNISDPLGASFIHGINRDMTRTFGKDLHLVLKDFLDDVQKSDKLVAHNIEFDSNMIASELYRLGIDPTRFLNHKRHCTMKSNTDLVKKPFKNGDRLVGPYKWPSLGELYEYCFGSQLPNAHHALADVENTVKCYYFIEDIVDLS